MDFTSDKNEGVRLLALAVGAAVVELFVLPSLMFAVLKASAQYSPGLQALVLLLPRFAIMAVLVGLLGPFRRGLWFGGFLVLYAVLLLLRFSQTEVYVDWGSTMAAARATLPYLGGVAGALFGFWLRRRGATRSVTASEKPSLHA